VKWNAPGKGGWARSAPAKKISVAFNADEIDKLTVGASREWAADGDAVRRYIPGKTTQDLSPGSSVSGF
jgi:hypothetical protein